MKHDSSTKNINRDYEVKQRYKMYKSGKQWMYAPVLFVALGLGAMFGGATAVSADTVQPSPSVYTARSQSSGAASAASSAATSQVAAPSQAPTNQASSESVAPQPASAVTNSSAPASAAVSNAPAATDQTTNSATPTQAPTSANAQTATNSQAPTATPKQAVTVDHTELATPATTPTITTNNSDSSAPTSGTPTTPNQTTTPTTSAAPTSAATGVNPTNTIDSLGDAAATTSNGSGASLSSANSLASQVADTLQSANSVATLSSAAAKDTKGASLKPQMLAAKDAGSTANVATASDFVAAIANSAVTTINVTSDFAIIGQPDFVDTTARNLVIQGNNHTIDFRHTSYRLAFSNPNDSFTFSNLTMFGSNYYGPAVSGTGGLNNQIIFNNITYTGPQLVNAIPNTIVFQGTDKVTLVTSYTSPIDQKKFTTDDSTGGQQIVEGGAVTVADGATLNGTTFNGMPIQLYGTGSFTVGNNATVNLTRSAQPTATFANAQGGNYLIFTNGNVTIGANSKVTLRDASSGGHVGINLAGSNKAITVGDGSTLNVLLADNNNDAITTNNGSINVGKNATLNVSDGDIQGNGGYAIDMSGNGTINTDLGSTVNIATRPGGAGGIRVSGSAFFDIDGNFTITNASGDQTKVAVGKTNGSLITTGTAIINVGDLGHGDIKTLTADMPTQATFNLIATQMAANSNVMAVGGGSMITVNPLAKFNITSTGTATGVTLLNLPGSLTLTNPDDFTLDATQQGANSKALQMVGTLSGEYASATYQINAGAPKKTTGNLVTFTTNISFSNTSGTSVTPGADANFTEMLTNIGKDTLIDFVGTPHPTAPTATINQPISNYDRSVSGTGKPGEIVTVVYQNYGRQPVSDTSLTATVGADGKWTINTLPNVNPNDDNNLAGVAKITVSVTDPANSQTTNPTYTTYVSAVTTDGNAAAVSGNGTKAASSAATSASLTQSSAGVDQSSAASAANSYAQSFAAANSTADNASLAAVASGANAKAATASGAMDTDNTNATSSATLAGSAATAAATALTSENAYEAQASAAYASAASYATAAQDANNSDAVTWRANGDALASSAAAQSNGGLKFSC